MTTIQSLSDNPDLFIHRWQASSATERANYQLFLSELCDILHVPRPSPALADDSLNTYIFEKPVTFHHPDGSTSLGRIDLNKGPCLVLEVSENHKTTAPPVGATNRLIGLAFAVPFLPQGVSLTVLQQE